MQEERDVKTLEVIIQESGVILHAETGYLIGKLLVDFNLVPQEVPTEAQE